MKLRLNTSLTSAILKTVLVSVCVINAETSFSTTSLSHQSSARLDSDKHDESLPVPPDQGRPDLHAWSGFDPVFMQGANIPTDVGSILSKETAFLNGRQLVTLVVNGNRRFTRFVEFNKAGQPCLHRQLLVGVAIGITDAGQNELECIDLVNVLKGSEVLLDPNEQTVQILVPPEFLQVSESRPEYVRGGRGGVVNYTLTHFGSNASGSSHKYQNYLDTEIGFNLSEWAFRSRQTFSSGSYNKSSKWQSAFLQRSIADDQAIFQIGRVSMMDAFSGGGSIDGVQIYSDSALGRGAARFPIRGQANSNARVELYQQGRLLYAINVPRGAFTIENYPAPSPAYDLEVKIIEDGVLVRTQFVPSSDLQLYSSLDSGDSYSFGAGRLNDSLYKASLRERPILLSFSKGLSLGRTGFSAGMTLAGDYFGLRGLASTRLTGSTSLGGFIDLASDRYRGQRGQLLGVSASTALSSDSNLRMSANARSDGYRSVLEAYSIHDSASLLSYKTQASIGWDFRTKQFGALSTNISRQTTRSGRSVRSLFASYSYGFDWGSVSITAGRRHDSVPGRGSSNYANVEFNIPLSSGGNVRTFARSDSDVRGTKYGANYSHKLSDHASAYIGTEIDSHSTDPAYSVGASVLTPYTSLGASVSSNGKHNSYVATASGGMIAHASGVTPSPHRIRDTFGIVKLGDVSGVPIDTPGGTVWSMHDGFAAIPHIPPYVPSRVDVRDDMLPDDVEVEGAQRSVLAARNSVTSVNVQTKRVKRVLLDVRLDADRALLPVNSGILRNGSDYVTSVSSPGQVMIPDFIVDSSYEAILPDGSLCTIVNVELKDKPDGALFESGRASCVR